MSYPVGESVRDNVRDKGTNNELHEAMGTMQYNEQRLDGLNALALILVVLGVAGLWYVLGEVLLPGLPIMTR